MNYFWSILCKRLTSDLINLIAMVNDCICILKCINEKKNS